MSLIIKTTEKTTSNTVISLPPNTEDAKINVSTGDFITSYSPLVTGNTNKKFLTTECITDDTDSTSDVEVLSMSGFSAFEDQIFDIISNSNNNNVCNIVYSTATGPTTAKLYNVMNADGVIDITDETYLEEDSTTFDAIETNAVPDPVGNIFENLFAIDANDPTDNKVLKFLKDGVYKINYSLYFRLIHAVTKTAFTPHVKMVRGISDGTAAPNTLLIHHSSVMSDLTDEPLPSSVLYYPSYIVNNSDAITPAGLETYLYNISGSVTISVPVHDVAKTEYLGIFVGITLNANNTVTTIDSGVGTDKIYFGVNIEYIGT